MNRELIVNVNPTEISIALCEDKVLVELNKEQCQTGFAVGDIYLGKVRKIMPGLNAAFVNIGHEKDAFIHYLDLGGQFLSLQKLVASQQPGKRGLRVESMKLEPPVEKSGKIGDYLQVGQNIMVQIAKEAISTKGPRLTADISLAGRNVVLVPFSSKVFLPQKIRSVDEKKRLKRIAAAVLPDADAASVTVTYEAKAKISSKITAYVPLEGGWEKVKILPYEFPAIGVGTYQVKLTAGGTDTIVTVKLIDARADAKIVLKEGVSVTYTKDAAAMRTQILDKLVDWSQTTVSKEAAAESMVLEYHGTGYSKAGVPHKDWYPIEGGTVSFGIDYTASSLGAGENQKIRASFPTTADYHGCDAAEGTLTVDKANVRVKVQAAAISAGETLTTQQYVTTNPEDTFAIFKVYSGVTSGLSGIVYVQLPESMVSETALKVLDPIFKLATGKPLTKALQDGTTVGELRAFLKDNQKLLDGAADFLKLIGVDITAFTKLVDTLNSLPSVFDSTRVAFGSPNRAGMYLVTAIASNPNYNPGVGTGVLVVKMHTSGASLSWNNSETTYAASALKADTLNATLMRGDSAADNQDGVHYRYIGFTAAHKLYVSSKAPTEAGTYRQTAYIFGGNDMAKSISRTVTITAD